MPGHIISSRMIATLLEPEPLLFMNSIWMSQEVRHSDHGGLSAFQLHRFITMASKLCISMISMGMSRCSSHHDQLASAARLTVRIYIERLIYFMPYYDVVNLVTVTKMNISKKRN